VDGHVPAAAGQTRDRDRDDDAGGAQHDEQIPERRSGFVAEVLRQPDEQLVLKLERALQEAPGRERDQRSGRRGEDQEPDEPAAADELVGLLDRDLVRIRHRSGVPRRRQHA
jgi:hypothetical protein